MSAAEHSGDQLPLLKEPASGIPHLTDTAQGLSSVIRRLREGTGPFSVDTERASGIRYGQRAFLIQLKRDDAGTFLIDPEALTDLSELNEVLQDTTWILHAASQDLPCLHEAGLYPPKLFDTELAARLLGMPKVGLAALTEELLGIRLAKEHSAADWSQRPLPKKMLAYAALDVELLSQLKDILSQRLMEENKLEIAEQEFEAARLAGPPEPRVDPWRRTSGAHALTQRRDLAILKALWESREDLAEKRDIAPGRLLPDRALLAAIQAKPATVPQLLEVPGFRGRAAKRDAPRWLEAINAGKRAERLPPRFRRGNGSPPQPRMWAQRKPVAHARYQTARPRLQALADELNLPVENLLTPSVLRQISWDPPTPITPESIQERLAELGARPWQIAHVWAPMTVAFLEPVTSEEESY